MNNTITLIGIISWIVYSGGSIIIVSWLVGRIKAFASLSSDDKQVVVVGSSVAVALGFYAMLTYTPASVLAQLEPYFRIAYGTIIAYSGGKAVHGFALAAKKKREQVAQK